MLHITRSERDTMRTPACMTNTTIMLSFIFCLLRGQAANLLCPFAAATGICRMDQCPYLHGDMCPCCQKCCLHPLFPEQHQQHLEECVTDLEGRLKVVCIMVHMTPPGINPLLLVRSPPGLICLGAPHAFSFRRGRLSGRRVRALSVVYAWM